MPMLFPLRSENSYRYGQKNGCKDSRVHVFVNSDEKKTGDRPLHCQCQIIAHLLNIISYLKAVTSRSRNV